MMRQGKSRRHGIVNRRPAAPSKAVHLGMQITFAVAATLITAALAIAVGTYRRRRAPAGH
ncbi:hypothetical protein CO652_05295 [Rhizobium sp. H4]|nr:hypothetical protein CO652_05295 [Rhizobium sp. H4]